MLNITALLPKTLIKLTLRVRKIQLWWTYLFSFSGASCFSSPGRLLHPVRSVGNVCLRSSSSHFPLAANYNSSLTIRTVAVKRRRDKWCAEQCPHSRLVRQLSQMSYSLPSTLPNNEALKGRKEERKQPAKLSRRPAALKKKKNHTHQHEISNVALMLHWYTNRKEFSCLLDECFSSLLGDVSSSTYSPRCEFVAAAVFTQIRIYRVDIGDRSSVSAGVWTKAWKNEVS